MATVKIIYHTYLENMTIFVDGEPVGAISSLTRYQARPITECCRDIFDAIVREVNDRYELVYSGRECEYRLLESFAGRCDMCTGIRFERPALDESALTRLKKLSRLIQDNGLEFSRTRLPLTIITDLDADNVRNMLSSHLPKLAVGQYSLDIVSPDTVLTNEKLPVERSALNADKKFTIAVLSRNYRDVSDISNKTSGIIKLGTENIDVPNDTVIIPTVDDSIDETLAELLELVYYPNILKLLLSRLDIDNGNPFYNDVFVLDKTEPQLFVRLPLSIEYGMTVPIMARMIPEGARLPQIIVRVSNDEVISYTGSGFTATGTGEAVVEVYEAGKNVPVASGRITAYRTNFIKKLTIPTNEIRVCVDDCVSLGYDFYPHDAEDKKRIKFLSDNGSVAYAKDDGQIVARLPGECLVYYKSERAESERCLVRVFPKLEEISASIENGVIETGKFSKITIKRVPEEAVLDTLSIKVDPPSLGEYDKGSGSFFARNPGEGKIIIKSDRRQKVSTVIPVVIKKKHKSFNPLPLLIAAGCVIAFIMYYIYFG